MCVCMRGMGREATYCRVRRGDTGRAIAQRRKITTTRDEINELTEKLRLERGLYKLTGGGCVTFSSVNGDDDGEEDVCRKSLANRSVVRTRELAGEL